MMQLQHRGQDAAGIVTLNNDSLYIKRGRGRVEEVFSKDTLSTLQGSLGIGHTRYATSGGEGELDVQPFSTQEIALAHSGHLHPALWMNMIDEKKLSSRVDSNLLLHFLGSLLDNRPDITNQEHFFSFLSHTITSIFQQVTGGYCLVSLIKGKGLLITRDPSGVRPLAMAERESTSGVKEYLFASESHFFSDLGFKQTKDIEPGEIVYITAQGRLYRRILVQRLKTPCSFEYIYFAKPKSIMDGVLVENARRRMGRLLALRWQQLHPQLKPDFVLPIPNTANTAALAFAHHLGFTYQEYLQVNKQSGRTFIQDNDTQRQLAVRNKLKIEADKIKNKIILLFDDSIVRGTTVTHVIKTLKDQGAKTIYLVLACPPIINVCTYGINIATYNELIASERSIGDIKFILGVDELFYATTEELIESIYPHPPTKCALCMQCMVK
jgi:amidophosphoribosyltransferase